MIVEVLQMLGPWTWWVIGILLAAVEVVAPGAFFLWFAMAAILVGTIALVVDLGWQAELLLFIVFAAVAAFLGRRFYGTVENRSAAGPLNDRLRGQIGRPAILETPLSNGTGHIRLDDTLWRVEGPDLPAGTPVTIVAVDKGRLRVEAR